jgi:mannitol-specific phosphotransferase system IIBC component
MKATAIFVAFFLLFTSASIAVPIPLFPGSMITTLLAIPPSDYIPYLEALTNGLTYGFISWAVFFLLARKIENSLSTDSKRITR